MAVAAVNELMMIIWVTNDIDLCARHPRPDTEVENGKDVAASTIG